MLETSGAGRSASLSAGVRIEAADPRGMVTLRADLGAAAVAKAVKAAVGVDVPAVRCAALSGGRGALWMSPDELLLVMPHDDAPGAVASLSKALDRVHHLVVEVSDARAVFRLTGDTGAVREVLARLTPADMSPGAFVEGEVRRTRLGQVAAALWMEDGGVTLVCFRSVARYVSDLLANAASGGSVGHWT